MSIDALLDQMLEENARENEKVKVTQKQIEQQAKFLLGWARDKRISRLQRGSTFYSKGKLMTKLYPAEVRGLLAQGYAAGNEESFTMVKDKVKEIK